MAAAGQGEGRRLLVATGTAVGEVAEIPTLVRALLDAASEILVITPVLPSRLEWFVSDTDRARHQADERLAVVLGQIEKMGLSAEGQIGDETPLTALEDAVRGFSPDHLLVALRGAEDADWQERGLIDRVRGRLQLPVTVFAIGEADNG